MSDLQNVDVFFSVQSFTEEALRGKTAIIIDILRASSSIVTAISNGAKKLIAVEDMSDAVKMAKTMDPKDYLLCGEKKGTKIEGYDLGNSPLEYTPEAVSGKTLIFNTTNGTKAIKKSILADDIYIGAFLNQGSILKTIREAQNEVVLVCSGYEGRLALEDTMFAGSLVYHLFEGKLPETVKDGAKVAFGLYEKFGDDLTGTINSSDHAKRLAGLVPEGDVPFCCEVDKFNVLPGMKDGILTDLNG